MNIILNLFALTIMDHQSWTLLPLQCSRLFLQDIHPKPNLSTRLKILHQTGINLSCCTQLGRPKFFLLTSLDLFRLCVFRKPNSLQNLFFSETMYFWKHTCFCLRIFGMSNLDYSPLLVFIHYQQ